MTIAGQHNREPNDNPDQWTEYIVQITGKYPALWSGDLLFQIENVDDHHTRIKEAHRQWIMVPWSV